MCKMTGYIYESSYDTNSKLGKDIEHLKSDFDEIGVKLLLECEKSYTLLEACKIIVARFENIALQGESIEDFMKDGGLKEIVQAIKKAEQ